MKPKVSENELKTTVEQELKKMLAADGSPDSGRMQLVKVAIGYLAVQAKLEESEYGNWFNPEEGQEPAIDKPKRGRKPASVPSSEAPSFFDEDGGAVGATGKAN